jgi:hypothetical protein
LTEYRVKKSAAKHRKQKKTSRTSLKTYSRGVSKVIIVAIVAVILAVGGGVYVLNQNGSLGSALPLGRPALNPNCEYKDPELCKFFNNYANMPKSYSVTSTGNYGGMATESVYSLDGENYQMIAKQNGKETSNMISIGDTMYTLDYTDNKWWKMTSKPVETMEEDMADEVAFNPQETEDTTTYKFVTKEACGDRTCFKYEVITPDSEGKMYIWFDDRDYLTRKMRMEDGNGISSESVYSYGNVSITAPSPVKEGNPYSGSGGSMPSEAEAQKMMQQYQQSAESGDYSSETPIDDSSSDGF